MLSIVEKIENKFRLGSSDLDFYVIFFIFFGIHICWIWIYLDSIFDRFWGKYNPRFRNL